VPHRAQIGERVGGHFDALSVSPDGHNLDQVFQIVVGSPDYEQSSVTCVTGPEDRQARRGEKSGRCL